MTWALPPLVLGVKADRWPTLWLPLLLLWPLLVAVFALGLVLSPPLALALRAPVQSVLRVLLLTFRLLCALHGTELVLSASTRADAAGPKRTWKLSLY